MSKIGRLPIEIASGTTVTINGNVISASGVKGQAELTLFPGVTVTLENNVLTVTQDNIEDLKGRANFGLARALLANLVKGVMTGFEKKLEIVGMGYRAVMQGETLVLSLGFSHPVKFTLQAGVKFAVVDNAIIVSGIHKDDVGEEAANIRSAKPPEPYKGKGIRYSTERVQRKAGKAAKAVGGK
jgi:large subunit ribosomal protein L6